MKKIFFVFILLGLVMNLAAQEIKAEMDSSGKDITIKYVLSGDKKTNYIVELYYSLDGEKTYTGPISDVKGDMNKKLQPGKYSCTLPKRFL